MEQSLARGTLRSKWMWPPLIKLMKEAVAFSGVSGRRVAPRARESLAFFDGAHAVRDQIACEPCKKIDEEESRKQVGLVGQSE